MKTIILAAILFSSAASAWGPYGPYGPGFGGYGGWGGYPYGAYGAMGYGWGIQAPSFNYNTVIQQSPPIVINNNDPNYGYQQRPQYQDPCPQNTCRR